MSKHLVAHPEFIKAFVSECFSNGFNEKQASELLDNYAKAEFYTTDPEYRAGFESAIKKEANILKALGQFAIPVGAGIAAGGLAGGLMPAGIISNEYTGGAGTGALAGGLLGLLATRGKGLGGALSRIGTAVRGGGVGRATAKELGNLVSNPKLLKGLASGAGAGLFATGTNNLMNEGRFPKMDPNTGVPWYMNETGSGGIQSSNSSAPNPFELPPEIMARVQGGGNYGGGATTATGPMALLSNNKSQLVDLDNTITNMQNSLPSGSNPTSFGQRQSMQAEIDNLKMRRNQLAKSVGALENQINTDKSNMFNLAAERQQAAEQGLTSTRNEFDMLRRRQQIADQGGLMGGLMGLYNSMTGVDNRLKQLDPMYSSYAQQAEQARKIQGLAQ